MRDPLTPEEWQEAADLAELMLHIDSARQYGLIETDIRPMWSGAWPYWSKRGNAESRQTMPLTR